MYSTRKSALKQIDMAAGNMDDALEHLLRVKKEYQDEHPDHAEAVQSVMLVVLKTQQVIQRLHLMF